MEYEILLSGSSMTDVKTEAIVGQAVEEEPKGANVGLLVGILVFIIIVLVIAVVIYQKKNSELKTELNGPEECFLDFSQCFSGIRPLNGKFGQSLILEFTCFGFRYKRGLILVPVKGVLSVESLL